MKKTYFLKRSFGPTCNWLLQKSVQKEPCFYLLLEHKVGTTSLEVSSSVFTLCALQESIPFVGRKTLSSPWFFSPLPPDAAEATDENADRYDDKVEELEEEQLVAGIVPTAVDLGWYPL